MYFNQLIFGNSQLPHFISHAEKFKELSQADIIFYNHSIKVTLSPQTITDDHRWLTLEILYMESDWQLSSLMQVCSSSLPPGPLSFLEHLDIHEDQYSRPLWQDNVENVQWLEFLYPFTAMKNLYLLEELRLHVTPTLQGLLGERAAEVLPALQKHFIAGLGSFRPVQEAIGPFIESQQHFGRPTAVQLWEIELEQASGSEYGRCRSLLCSMLADTTKTFCSIKTAKAVLPLRYRLICQGLLPLSMSSGPLLSADVRERGIVEYYCQDRQETRLGVLETLKESLSIERS